MDKVEKYRVLIEEIIQERQEVIDADKESLMVIRDPGNGQFILIHDSWTEEDRRFYGVTLHLQLTPEGKIVFYKDGTDQDLAGKLVEKGVAKCDMVLAFHPEHLRELTEFAVS